MLVRSGCFFSSPVLNSGSGGQFSLCACPPIPEMGILDALARGSIILVLTIGSKPGLEGVNIEENQKEG